MEVVPQPVQKTPRRRRRPASPVQTPKVHVPHLLTPTYYLPRPKRHSKNCPLANPTPPTEAAAEATGEMVKMWRTAKDHTFYPTWVYAPPGILQSPRPEKDGQSTGTRVTFAPYSQKFTY